jgi:hypothetical protein
MNNYKIKFKNGRTTTICCDSNEELKSDLVDLTKRFNSEIATINDMPTEKLSVGGFLLGTFLGGILGNSVAKSGVKKTAKTISKKAKTTISKTRKGVSEFRSASSKSKKYSGGGGVKPIYISVLNELYELKDKGIKQVQLNGFTESIGYVIGLRLDDTEIKKVGNNAYITLYSKGGGTKQKQKINKKYTHFAVSKEDGKIADAWETLDDIETLKHYANLDLKDNDHNPKDFNILSGKTLIKRGINPYDSDNWGHFSTRATRYETGGGVQNEYSFQGNTMINGLYQPVYKKDGKYYLKYYNPTRYSFLADESDIKNYRIGTMYEDGGMSSMAVAGAVPELAIADQISQRLPATTSAVDKRIAERIYSDRPSMWEDRGLKYYAGGGGVKKRNLMSMANLVDWKGEGIKKWYIRSYPTDDLGEELNDTNTFTDLWNSIHKGKNVYNIMGVGDSVIRERLFEYLSLIYDVDYSYVYNKWLESADEYAKGGLVGENITFKHWSGDTKNGTITEDLGEGNFQVSSGFGNVLVNQEDIISTGTKSPERKKMFGFFKGGGSTTKKPYTFTNDPIFTKGKISIQRVGGSTMWNVAINQKPMGRILDAYTKEQAFKKVEKEKFAGGGSTNEGIDLFEDYENIPPEVQAILDKYSQGIEDGDYNDLGDAKNELEGIGYTFDFYLDGVAYDLRPIGSKGKVEE